MSSATPATISPPYPVRVHHYLPSSSSSPPHPVQTYEHLPTNSPLQSAPAPPRTCKNALVFIGGLGDGPHTIPYVRRLAEHLALSPSPSSTAGPYAVFEARLSSAHSAFGYASLAQDAREMADLVRYLRGGLGMRRVVLMGHSTGCQDVLEFATSAAVASSAAGSSCSGSRSSKQGGESGDGGEVKVEVKVDGYVLQGPVSDREAMALVEDRGEVEAALGVAERMVKEGRGGEVMERSTLPRGWRGSPVTAYRWRSLAEFGGDDDYFSSDLPDEKLADVWGRLEQPVLILPSEKDEWVPAKIDVARLVDRWKSFCRPGIASELSGLIPGANHRVEDVAGQEWLADRVARFMAEIEKQ